MTRTSCLYFHSPDSGAAPMIVAKDYCHWEDFPFLWRLMLAESKLAAPLPINVTGNPIEGSIAVSARDAIDRVQFFVDYINAGHPLLHRLPELPVFLDSVLVFLRERLAAFPSRDAKKIQLVAQEGEGTACDPGLLQDFEVDWIDIQIFSNDEAYHELDTVMGFAGSRHSFERWESWTRLFGLSTLDHPYFTRLEYSMYWDKYLPPPDALSYKQFVRTGGHDGGEGVPDPAEDPPRSAWSLLKGVAQSIGLMRAGAPAAAAPPEPDSSDDRNENDDEDDNEEDEDDEEDDAGYSGAGAHDPWQYDAFAPVVIDGKVGLRFLEERKTEYHMEFTGPDVAPDVLALPAEWDEIVPDWGDGAWVRRGNQWGVIDLRRRCRILMEPSCDQLIPCTDETPSYVIINGRYGVVNMQTGGWSLQPEYDEITWRREGADETWQVRKGLLWGVAGRDGTILQPCIFDSMMADQSGNYLLQEHGWQVLQNGRAGWVTMLGELDVACEWDEIKPCVSAGLYAVGRAGRWGLAVSGNRLWIPCQYLAVAPLAIANHVRQQTLMTFWYRGHDFWSHAMDIPGEVDRCDPALSNLLIAVTNEAGVGVVDQAHRQLLPCAYKAIAPVKCGDFHDARWLYVTANDGREGLWSMDAGGETFPCEFESIDVFVAPRLETPLVGTMRDGEYRLWNLDGTPAFDASFISIRARDWRSTPDMRPGVGELWRADIAHAWLKGRPVRATQAVDGEVRVVYLLPGRPILSEHDVLVDAYMTTGDRQSALTLAKQYFTGFHRAANLETARLWAARACGESAPAPSPTLKTYAPYRFSIPVQEGLADVDVEAEADVEDQDEPADDAETLESALPSGAVVEEDVHDRYEFLDEEDDGDGDEDDDDLREDCAHLYAKMLDEGLGGLRDAPLARRWAIAAAYDSYNTHAPSWVRLGKLLIDETAGPVDIATAYEVLQNVHAPSLNEGEATYYSACCLRKGLDGTPDLEGARTLMVRADACGEPLAAPALAELIGEIAKQKSGKEARLLSAEAAYYVQKAEAAAKAEVSDD